MGVGDIPKIDCGHQTKMDLEAAREEWDNVAEVVPEFRNNLDMGNTIQVRNSTKLYSTATAAIRSALKPGQA
jgi:hypothetical protein